MVQQSVKQSVRLVSFSYSPFLCHSPKPICTSLNLSCHGIRADGQDVPRNAPIWWGCPRGPGCEFAHGEDELRGDRKESYELQKQSERRDVERQKKDTYMGAVESNQSSDQMASMVAAGLGRLNKKNKKNKCASGDGLLGTTMETATEVTEFPPAGKVLAVSEKMEETMESSFPSSATADAHTRKEENTDEKCKIDMSHPAWLHSASTHPSSSSLIVHPGGVVECTQGFGTALVHPGEAKQHNQEQEQEREGRCTGRWLWYYEVELISGGLMQVGNEC